jgi:hypothetical protein
VLTPQTHSAAGALAAGTPNPGATVNVHGLELQSGPPGARSGGLSGRPAQLGSHGSCVGPRRCAGGARGVGGGGVRGQNRSARGARSELGRGQLCRQDAKALLQRHPLAAELVVGREARGVGALRRRPVGRDLLRGGGGRRRRGLGAGVGARARGSRRGGAARAAAPAPAACPGRSRRRGCCAGPRRLLLLRRLVRPPRPAPPGAPPRRRRTLSVYTRLPASSS